MNGAVTKNCEESGFHFVSNGNIFRKHLCKDSAHLTDERTNVFAGNIVDYIRHFILKEFWNEVACNDKHFEDQNKGIDKGSSENKDSDLKNKEDLNPLSVVKNLGLKNGSKIIIGQININSILSKFNQLKELVLKHVDILVICETKLDETFPSSQFHMDGFSLPYRLDRNRNGGVLWFLSGKMYQANF